MKNRTIENYLQECAGIDDNVWIDFESTLLPSGSLLLIECDNLELDDEVVELSLPGGLDDDQWNIVRESVELLVDIDHDHKAE